MNPKPLLHLQGAAIFALGIAAYRFSHASWWLLLFYFSRQINTQLRAP